MTLENTPDGITVAYLPCEHGELGTHEIEMWVECMGMNEEIWLKDKRRVTPCEMCDGAGAFYFAHNLSDTDTPCFECNGQGWTDPNETERWREATHALMRYWGYKQVAINLAEHETPHTDKCYVEGNKMVCSDEYGRPHHLVRDEYSKASELAGIVLGHI